MYKNIKSFVYFYYRKKIYLSLEKRLGANAVIVNEIQF